MGGFGTFAGGRLGARHMLAVFIAMALALVALLLPVTYAHAVDDAGEVGAANVVHYDVSTAKRGADYRITASGDYYLSGSTNRVSIVVQPPENGTVNIYLENGLRIDADFTGRGWSLSSAPAISIGEATGATVNIITLEGAQAYLGGYRGAPAIRKNGTATRLVFNTRTSNEPGTLTAVASSEGSTPAIGSNGGSGTVAGNIHFESGKVEARGHDAPAIGCKDGNLTLKDLTISGGEVIATGSGANSAGIGGGKGGHAEKITISGGTVRATGSGGGAGIGSGSGGCASTITVNGGTVTAKGGTAVNGGAGIGSGAGGSASTITVSGGTVDATGGGYAAGIGCGAGENVSVSGIIVRGGTVTAIGSSTGGAGIGAGYQCSSCHSIHIVGGTITATGGRESSGIGTGPFCQDLSIIAIEGGLIKATGGQSSTGDIGSYRAKDVSVSGGTVDGTIAVQDDSPAVITGGSVRAFADGSMLVDGHGEPVYRTVATVVGLTASTKITDLNIGIGQGSSAARYDYGTTDLYTLADGGVQNLFVYLPGSTYTRTAEDVDGRFYRGNVYPGETGQLKPTTNVLLDNDSGYDGAAFATVGETSIEITEDPLDDLDREVDYYADSAGRRVADSNGMLYEGETEYTSGGVWTYTGSSKATLRTVWEAKTYTIVYEGNRPEDASTELVGNTVRVPVEAGAADAHINSGGFSLPGYEFTGWNTDPDGFGKDYAGGEPITNDLFLDADDDTVTLYAQWEPYTYKVTFEAGDDSGETKIQEMTFDQEEALGWNPFDPPSSSSGSSFLYWEDEDGKRYAHGEVVKNLCTIDSQLFGNQLVGQTLTAQWSPDNEVVITIFNNGEPVVLDYPETDIVLVSTENPTTTLKDFQKTKTAGVYSRSEVDPGEYTVDISTGLTSGFPTDTKKVINVEAGQSNSFSASYCTITVRSADSDYVDAWIGESQPSTSTNTRAVFQGETVKLRAVVNPKSESLYVFDCYDVEGVMPEGLNLSKAEAQTITVNGGVTITAHARPATYSIEFVSNYPAGASTKGQASGEMATTTNLLSTEEYKLPACAFTLPGYTFTGWRAQDGITYVAGATVRNLAKSDNETVTLEAQWKPNTYTVAFDANGGEGSMNSQEFTFDSERALSLSTFARDGYTFAGWSTEAHPLSDDQSGATYVDGASVSNLTTVDGATVTLYAQWERDTYTVTFAANATDAVGSMDSESVPTNEDWLVAGCGFTRAGYVFDAWNTSADGTGKSYEAGTTAPALALKDGEVTLYAQWSPISYTIAFDANVPVNASTADQLIGTMREQKLAYDQSADLRANAFLLPGYEFMGWKTEADGAGTLYTDEASVENLATEDGATVTLYAQWKALTYEVRFDSDGGSGTMQSQHMTFDQSASLSVNTFTNGDQIFIGWAISGETGSSTLIGDGETVVNLCTIDDDGKPQGHTLSAIWAWGDDVFVTLTKDNIAVENVGIVLVADRRNAIRLKPYNRVPGVYFADEIEPGIYRVIADGYPAGKVTVEVKDGKTATVALDYSTITVSNGDTHVDVQFDDSLGGSSRVVLTRDPVRVRSAISDGYVFEGYTVSGIAPGSLDADTPAAQTITVQGKVTLTGHARPVQYTIEFDANGGEGFMFPQDFTYDVAQTLEPNAFTRDGYVFSGWNTKSDGSGTFYADQAQTSNLTTEDGAIVTLYAQWSTVGPNPPRPPATTYAVTVNTHAHGSAAADRKTASAGATVTVTIDPDEGFELRDISALDGQGRLVELTACDDGTYTFTMPASSVTVQVLLGCDGGDLCPSRRFPDADPTQWYHDPLDWAIVHGILGGYSDTGLMGPEDAVTRAQMAQIIWNAEGRPSATDAKGFSDVSEDDWFAESVLWAQSAGVFVGYEGTDLFGPNDPLTREQATAVMMRWEQLNGNDVSARIDLSSFPDASGVSAWALESMSWGVAADIISGVDQPDGSVLLDAQGTCTRAQMATLMMRLRAVDQLDPFA